MPAEQPLAYPAVDEIRVGYRRSVGWGDFTPQQATALVGLLGASQAIGRVVAGFLVDSGRGLPGVAAFLRPVCTSSSTAMPRR